MRGVALQQGARQVAVTAQVQRIRYFSSRPESEKITSTTTMMIRMIANISAAL